MSGPLIFLALDIATIVCAALLGARVLASGAGSRAAGLLVAIMACNICHIVLSRYEYGPWIPPAFRIAIEGWRPALNLARNLTPGLFMIFSHTLFAQGRRFPPWLLGLFVLQAFLEEPARWLAPGLGLCPAWRQWATGLAAALQALFAGAAIAWAVGGWRSDLVETRRRLRVATVLVVGADVLGASLITRVIISPGDPANYGVHVGLVAINLAILAFLLLTHAPDAYAPDKTPAREAALARPPPTSVAEAEGAQALARLKTLLEVERIYRQPGLSLGDLATRVGVPAYRLRRLIHEVLGYRNFNLFLHHYRTLEAREQLRDPALRRTPILTIALSVGYQSVNTFNRGFAEVVGMTPSAYRAGVEETSPNSQ